jgi:Intracellular proteinase inhibitor
LSVRGRPGLVVLAVASAAAIAVVIVAAVNVRAGGEADPVASSARTSALIVQVDLLPLPPRARQQVRWRVRVTNRAATPRTLTFRTSQQADITLRRGGVVRYRWSEGRSFIPVVDRRRLPAGRSLTFVLADRIDVPPGRYEVVATVTARPAQRPARATIAVS